MECANNLIGISQSDCRCITAYLTEYQQTEMRLSKSGLYLDELAGVLPFGEIQNDDCENNYKLYKECINSAINETFADLVTKLYEKNKKRLQGYNGTIGQNNLMNKHKLKSDTASYGLQINPVFGGNSLMTIRTINLFLAENGTANVLVYRKDVFGNDEIIYNEQITIVGSKVNTIRIDENDGLSNLPLRNQDGKYVYYVVVLGADNIPFKNKISCNCGNSEKELKKIVSIKGVQINSDEEITEDNTFSYGISIGASIQCDNNLWLCDAIANDPVGSKIIPYAIRFKAGEIMMQKILSSEKLSYLTLLSREQMYGKREHFRKEYESRIIYLASKEGLDISKNECFECNPFMTKTTIFK